jgi:acetyltransferase EpsM
MGRLSNIVIGSIRQTMQAIDGGACEIAFVIDASGHPLGTVTDWDMRRALLAGAEVGPECQLLPGSIVNAGANLEKNVIVNSGDIMEPDCVIGDHAHIATGAKLASTVQVGIGAHIAAGATVRQSIRIGEGVIVGAGAIVVKDVGPGVVVAGVPARPIR